MKYCNIGLTKFVISLLIFFSFAAHSLAASLMSPSHRQDKWDLSLITRYLDSTTVDFKGGAQASINEEWGFGFGLGYNYTEHWAFNFDIAWGDVGYSGTRIDDNGAPETVSGTLRTSNANFSGIYNFSAKQFTPFVGASLGWVFVDSNIPSGPAGTICWWDPWWGYVCSGAQPTKTSTNFTYGVSAGLRFDVKENVFLRPSVGKTWADFESASTTAEFTYFRFDIGLMY